MQQSVQCISQDEKVYACTRVGEELQYRQPEHNRSNPHTVLYPLFLRWTILTHGSRVYVRVHMLHLILQSVKRSIYKKNNLYKK